MTLFDHHRQQIAGQAAPLSTRMRPRTLAEFVGQAHILGPGKVLRKAIQADRAPSIILWGPPGSGKTTLARLMAEETSAHFEQMSAVTSGVAAIRDAVRDARDRLGSNEQRTILFVDEIHRFSRSQQDALLPHVEEGTLTLVGATTENPSFEVIGPLLSRCRVFTLNQLTDDEVGVLLDRAMADAERGLGGLQPRLSDDALALLLRMSNGDARTALDALELAVESTDPGEDGRRRIEAPTVEDALQRRGRYDKSGDLHYDTISAFIKSVRGSDPDAAIYWLARMVDAGEDPLFIARRIVILAAEDIGLADPMALPLAVAAQQAVHFIGMPEGRIPLAEATVYLATAPKSNSAYSALGRAMADVNNTRHDPVPLHLRNAPTGLMKQLGYGRGYKYSHDYEGHFAAMENLPANLQGRKYFEPGDQGAEKGIQERLQRWWGQSDRPTARDNSDQD